MFFLMSLIINKNKMSIYSGFATRQQEQAYDSLVADLIQVLQRRVVKFYAGQEADEIRFHTILANIHHHLAKMEQCKYLEPKMSNTFRELIAVTAAISANATQQLQDNAPQHIQPQIKKQPSIPRQSLSFSSDKLSNDLKNWSIGRIKHQVTSKEDGASSRGQANPQLFIMDKNVKRAASTHFSKQAVKNRDIQRLGAMFDFDPPSAAIQPQKKNIQYIIRQYVSKGKRKGKRRSYFD